MKIYEKMADWLIPALLGAAIYFLFRITDELQSMHVDFAVDHERIGRLEQEVGIESPSSMPRVRLRPVQRP